MKDIINVKGIRSFSVSHDDGKTWDAVGRIEPRWKTWLINFRGWLDDHRPIVLIKLYPQSGFMTMSLSRMAIWMWLKHRVFHVPEGVRSPWYALVVRSVLFPVQAWKNIKSQNGARAQQGDQ